MRFDNFSRFFIFSIIGCLTMPGVLFGPAIVGILVDHGSFSEEYAGWVMAFGALGSAVTLLIISGFIHRINLKRLAYISLFLAVILDAYSAFNANPEVYFLIIRFFLGIFTTIANIAVYTSIASFQNYERGYGLFVLMQYSLSGLGLYYLILYSDYLGVQGLYLFLALLNFIALIMIRSFPDLNTESPSNHDSKSEIKVLLTGVTCLAILGFGIHEMAGVAQFTYIERIGVAISIENQSLSNIMLIASLLGVPGSMICIVLGRKFGLLPPMLFGVFCCLIGMGLLLYTQSYLTYALRMCLIGFGWSIVLPYIQSHLASLDKKGSALAAGNSFATIGAAAGAALGATLIGQNSNYDGLLQVSMVIYMLAVLFIIISIKSRNSVHE